MSEIKNPEKQIEKQPVQQTPEKLRSAETRKSQRDFDDDTASVTERLSPKSNLEHKTDVDNREKDPNETAKVRRDSEDNFNSQGKENVEKQPVEKNENYKDFGTIQNGTVQNESLIKAQGVESNKDAPEQIENKIPAQEYNEIMSKSIHNAQSDTLTLGKYEPSIKEDGTKDYEHPSPNSYNMIAERNGDMYFDMKDGLYNETLEKYDLSYQEMFDYFNVPALDLAASQGKSIRFTVDPESDDRIGTFTEKEWEYLQEKWDYSYLIEEGGFYYAEK